MNLELLKDAFDDVEFDKNDFILKGQIPSFSQYCNVVNIMTEIWRERVQERVNNEKVKPFPGEPSPWFRGFTSEKYFCEPSLLRKDEWERYFPRELSINFENSEIRKDYIKDIEKYLLQRFKNHGSYLLERLPENEIQWLSLMRHHGCLTRLLDWSKSSTVALFFAIYKYYEKEQKIKKNSS